MPRVVLLSSSLLTDRILLYSDVLSRIAANVDLEVWASSATNPTVAEEWTAVCPTRPLPAVGELPSYPHMWVRRLNEAVWDRRFPTRSRTSMLEHRPDRVELYGRVQRAAGLLARARAEERMERATHRLLLTSRRSPEARALLEQARPELLVTTSPYRFAEPGIAAEAKRLGIPVVAFITSWDNLSTKGRLSLDYDGYLVWSETMRDELRRFYPHTRHRPVSVVGAPQFDVFFDAAWRESRERFCEAEGLDPSLPYILYAVGSPNFLREEPGAVQMAEWVERGDFGDVQLLVRPHPLHEPGDLDGVVGRRRVVLQNTRQTGIAGTAHTQGRREIRQWVNTFAHAALIVNLSSTAAIDAAFCDRPVVNLNYDPSPGGRDDRLIKDINETWEHFAPVASSGGVWLANSPDEVRQAVQAYLADPSLHAESRRRMAEHVCGFVDGAAGTRFADAVLGSMERVTTA